MLHPTALRLAALATAAILSACTKQAAPSDPQPVVEVLQNGAVYYQERLVYDPDRHGRDFRNPVTAQPLAELLRTIRRDGVANNTLRLVTETIGGTPMPLVDDPILILADKWTEWHYVGEVMKQCARPDTAFWKIELALAPQAPGQPPTARRQVFLPKDASGEVLDESEEALSVRIYTDNFGTPDYSEGGGGPGTVDPSTGRPYRFELRGHRVKWEVGPKPLYKLADVQLELQRIAMDPNSKIKDPKTGETRRMACVIEPMPGTCYDDVAMTADACNAAGFKDLQFASGQPAARK